MNKKSILLVEDEDVIAEDVLDTLGGFGYEIAGRASNGPDAISMARAEEPDLILMDVNIEGKMDGIDAARLIKESSDVPIIFLTSLGDDETLKRASITDPSGYVLKPFKERELRAAIQLAFIRVNKSPLSSITSEENSLSNSEKQISEIIKKIPLLSILEAKDIAFLAKNSKTQSFNSGEPIVFEGQQIEAGMLVLSGRVIALKSSPNGKEFIVELLPAGDPFGLLPTLDNGPHFYSLKAHCDTEILWISNDELIGTLELYPEVYKELLTRAFKRLRSAHDLSRALAHDRVEVRIASGLLALAPKFNLDNDHNEVAIEMTRQELGEMVGATSETVIRITKPMERQGILDLTVSGSIKILDTNALESICEEGVFKK